MQTRDVFDDGPTLGVGSDGNTHSDPFCAMIAPLGSHEARYGEFCDLCEARRRHCQDCGGSGMIVYHGSVPDYDKCTTCEGTGAVGSTQ